MEILHKDQEIQSLQHKLGLLEGEVEKAESRLSEAKLASADGESSKSKNNGSNL